MNGICKLCLEFKELQDSHLIPAFAYRIIRKSQGSDPVMLTARRVGVSSRQVTAHELSWDCEQRFRDNGEDWMAQQVFQGAEFPLLNRLKLAVPDWERPNHIAYSGAACGIDTAKLVYFGASVLWKASLRKWTIGTVETTTVDLGPYQELLRKFLLGEAAFPVDGVAIVTVCTDFESQGCFFTPCAIREGIVPGYSLLVLGVSFRFFFGPNVPEEFRRFCCVNSPRKRIILADHSKQSQHSYGHLFQTAREVGKLKELSVSKH
jgi:hypothetical protein